MEIISVYFIIIFMYSTVVLVDRAVDFRAKRLQVRFQDTPVSLHLGPKVAQLTGTMAKKRLSAGYAT